MTIFSILLGLLFLIQSQAIIVPLKQGEFKCMLVYSMGNDETIKIDITFPHILGWDKNDFYYLSLRNTKTHELQDEHLTDGRFLREISIL